jgi:hypothetical protein
MRKTWRDEIAPLVAAVLARCAGQTLEETRAALRNANPWPEFWVSRIWSDECRIQLGLKKRKERARVDRRPGQGQRELFAD